MAGMTLGKAWQQLSWLYYQYLILTSICILEPWERTVFHSMLVSIVGMALYIGYIFMPQHVIAILYYFEIVQWPQCTQEERPEIH
ncbi:serine palmitoyltransferase small subunit A-like [Monodelphis domestica]|uniref:Serine palmitoyltransferase small subunit A-like n=1 Tax=Monodelphis domestica TaxID=13616 RepID=F7ER49_MONDO|nr:serine palmitoyltransferase small subunit A-like [Monodelphis domestica]